MLNSRRMPFRVWFNLALSDLCQCQWVKREQTSWRPWPCTLTETWSKHSIYLMDEVERKIGLSVTVSDLWHGFCRKSIHHRGNHIRTGNTETDRCSSVRVTFYFLRAFHKRKIDRVSFECYFKVFQCENNRQRKSSFSILLLCWTLKILCRSGTDETKPSQYTWGPMRFTWPQVLP